MNELNFRKVLLYKDPGLLNIKTQTRYEIYKGEELIASVIIQAFINAKVYYRLKWFFIKPKPKFFVTRFEILSQEEIKLGQYNIVSWAWKKEKLIIEGENGVEEWVLEPGSRYFPLTHKNINKISLNYNNRSILYNFTLGNSMSFPGHYCLWEGTINYNQSDELVAILGIYLIEHLLFNQSMD